MSIIGLCLQLYSVDLATVIRLGDICEREHYIEDDLVRLYGNFLSAYLNLLSVQRAASSSWL